MIHEPKKGFKLDGQLSSGSFEKMLIEKMLAPQASILKIYYVIQKREKVDDIHQFYIFFTVLVNLNLNFQLFLVPKHLINSLSQL